MSHRAAVYTVELHPRGEPRKLIQLGDIDGQGTWLAEILNGYVRDLDIVEETKKLKCLSSEIEGNEILIMMEHGIGGVDAVIRSKDGEEKAHQDVNDSQDVECGCLLRLSRNETTGWLAVHVPNGRATKTMLNNYLRERFKQKYPDLILEINPYVLESVLKKAVDEGRIQQVKLVKRVEPSDRAEYGVEQWIADRNYGKIEVTIGSRLQQKAQHLLSAPLRRYLDNEDREGARTAIVVFQGIEFDEAKVVVTEPSGRSRTFNIERPAAGHPVTELMTGLSPGRPEPEEIFEGLRAALLTVGR